MSALLIALLFAAGVGTWIYTKLAQRTGGGNQRGAFMGAGVAAVLIFLFAFTLLKFVLNIK
jgi:xanthine/uracil permease